MLVHGGAASAAQFEALALRLTSNGYPADHLAALEYDSTFATATLADVHTSLDALVAGLRQRTGADQVDLVATGLGTFVAQTYLSSTSGGGGSDGVATIGGAHGVARAEPTPPRAVAGRSDQGPSGSSDSARERAGHVARYVNIDGGAGWRVPDDADVDVLALWGRGRHRHITDATNQRFPGLPPAELVASPHSFVPIFRFLTGEAPATRSIVPQPTGEVTISGRAIVEPYNLGVDGAALEIHALDNRTGSATPLATFPLAADGTWGPFEVGDRRQRYELVLTRDGVELARTRRGPFVRSDHLVRVTTSDPGPGLAGQVVDTLAANTGYVSITGAEGVPSPDRPPYPLDCDGPVPDAEPGTRAWFRRDANNLACTQRRHLDRVPHPVTGLPAASPALDAYRDPARHDDVRFRFDRTTIAGLTAEVYRPCAAGTCPDMPAGLATFEPPYPAVITLHGGGSNKELHWWSSQALAEAGYLTIAFDGASAANAQKVLDWLHAGTDPLAADFDGAHVGLAGHSIGGDVAATVAHGDPRVSAAVYWDRAGLSSPPVDGLRVPSLALMGDYGCPRPLVCPLEPRTALPDPAARGAKTQDFTRLRDAGIDTMQVALRAATHFDWVPDTLSGNGYTELVSTYYTVAWFDRYLRGADDPEVAADAFVRLTATTFDDSADRHHTGQGRYDPARVAASGDPYAGNLPYRLDHMPVAHRLSFYYPSRCYLTVPGDSGDSDESGRATSDDLRVNRCAP